MTDTTVWKFPLRLDDEQTIEIAGGQVRLLTVGLDPLAGGLALWVRLVPDADEPNRRHILIRGTGHPVPRGAEYIGTVIDAPFVWHVFDGGQA